MQAIEAQLVILFNIAYIHASTGNVTEAQATIEAILKKAVVIHLIIGQSQDADKPQRTVRGAKAGTKKQKMERDTYLVEGIAIDVIDKIFAISSPFRRSDLEANGRAVEEGLLEAWDEEQQSCEAVQRIGEVCMKAIQLLAIIDLSSSSTELWRRAKRVLQTIVQRHSEQADNKKSQAARQAFEHLLNLRCRLSRFTVIEEDARLRIDIIHYLLGVAYYLCRKPSKAIQALEQALSKLDGHFVDAHYLLGYLYLQHGDPAKIPNLLEPIIQEPNPLSPQLLNLLAIGYTLKGQLGVGGDTFKQVVRGDNCGYTRCSLLNMTKIYGKLGMIDIEEDCLAALRNASKRIEAARLPFETSLERHEDGPAEIQSMIIMEANDVSAMTLEYSFARFALQQRDYKRALGHYRDIINRLEHPDQLSSSTIPEVLPVSGSILWREYIRCISAVGTSEEVVSACRHILITQHPDVRLLFALSDALHRHNQHDEALAALDRAIELLHDTPSNAAQPKSTSGLGKRTSDTMCMEMPADKRQEWKVQALNNKAMLLMKLGKHDDALVQLRSSTDLALTLPKRDLALETAYNLAILLAHMKREEEAAQAWLSARGHALDQTPEFYQQLASVATGVREGSYQELDRALGAVWAQKRRQDLINQAIQDAEHFVIDWED